MYLIEKIKSQSTLKFTETFQNLYDPRDLLSTSIDHIAPVSHVPREGAVHRGKSAVNTSVGRLGADSLRFRARARPDGGGLLGRRELSGRGGIPRGDISFGCTDAAAGDATWRSWLFPLFGMLARLLVLVLLPALEEDADAAEKEKEEDALRAVLLKRCCWVVVASLVAAITVFDLNMRCWLWTPSCT